MVTFTWQYQRVYPPNYVSSLTSLVPLSMTNTSDTCRLQYFIKRRLTGQHAVALTSLPSRESRHVAKTRLLKQKLAGSDAHEVPISRVQLLDR